MDHNENMYINRSRGRARGRGRRSNGASCDPTPGVAHPTTHYPTTITSYIPTPRLPPSSDHVPLDQNLLNEEPMWETDIIKEGLSSRPPPKEDEEGRHIFTLDGGKWTSRYGQLTKQGKKSRSFEKSGAIWSGGSISMGAHVAHLANTQIATQGDQSAGSCKKMTEIVLQAKATAGRNQKGKLYRMPHHKKSPTSHSVHQSGSNASQSSYSVKMSLIVNAVVSMQQTLDQLVKNWSSSRSHGRLSVHPARSNTPPLPPCDATNDDEYFDDDDDDYYKEEFFIPDGE